MYRKFLLTILIILSACTVGVAPYRAAADEAGMKFTFLIYVKELAASDLEGPGLPNIKKIRDNGTSYRNPSNSAPSPESSLLGLLGEQDNLLHLPLALAGHGIKTLLVDGSGDMPRTLLQESGVAAIVEKSDRRAMDEFLASFNDHPHQFVVIYLDDVSRESEGRPASNSHRLSTADNQVGRLVHHLGTSGKLARSNIIITGGVPKPPLITFGNNFNNNTGYYYCRQRDIAPTICKIYGIKPPVNLPGNILYESLSPLTVINLNNRVIELQQQCLLNQQVIDLLNEEHRLVERQKSELQEERNNYQRIISTRDQTIEQLHRQIKILKLSGGIAMLVLLTGYVFQYRILRKKFLLF